MALVAEELAALMAPQTNFAVYYLSDNSMPLFPPARRMGHFLQTVTILAKAGHQSLSGKLMAHIARIKVLLGYFAMPLPPDSIMARRLELKTRWVASAANLGSNQALPTMAKVVAVKT